MTPINYANTYHHFSIVEFLNDQCEKNKMICYLAFEGNIRELEMCVSGGLVDVRFPYLNQTPFHTQNATPLHFAAAASMLTVMNFLIDKGAKVNAVNINDNS